MENIITKQNIYRGYKALMAKAYINHKIMSSHFGTITTAKISTLLIHLNHVFPLFLC